MRLLNVSTLRLSAFDDNDVPKYAIASHRWMPHEASYNDLKRQKNCDRPGYKKVLSFCSFVQTWHAEIEWIWIDTCCIDKKSSAELSESINSMFKWYANAEVCFAYLADVGPLSSGIDVVYREFKNSVSFTRGWTLQELLASKNVVFLDRYWEVVGNKGPTMEGTLSLNLSIADITGIPPSVIIDWINCWNCSDDQKWSWATRRTTTKEEDMAYCLLGIFGITMPLIYGEGRQAKVRLRQEIRSQKRMLRQRRLSKASLLSISTMATQQFDASKPSQSNINSVTEDSSVLTSNVVDDPSHRHHKKPEDDIQKRPEVQIEQSPQNTTTDESEPSDEYHNPAQREAAPLEEEAHSRASIEVKEDGQYSSRDFGAEPTKEAPRPPSIEAKEDFERRPSAACTSSGRDYVEYVKGKDGRPAVVVRRSSEQPSNSNEPERRTSAEKLAHCKPPQLKTSKSSPSDIRVPVKDKQDSDFAQDEPEPPMTPAKHSETMPRTWQTASPEGLATPSATSDNATPSTNKYNYGRRPYADDAEYATPDGYRTEVREPSSPNSKPTVPRSPSPIRETSEHVSPREHVQSHHKREQPSSSTSLSRQPAGKAEWPSYVRGTPSPQDTSLPPRTTSYVYSGPGRGVVAYETSRHNRLSVPRMSDRRSSPHTLRLGEDSEIINQFAKKNKRVNMKKPSQLEKSKVLDSGVDSPLSDMETNYGDSDSDVSDYPTARNPKKVESPQNRTTSHQSSDGLLYSDIPTRRNSKRPQQMAKDAQRGPRQSERGMGTKERKALNFWGA